MKLYAVLANDADGTSWGNPVVIHDLPQTGFYTTVKVFNEEVFVGTYCQQDARPYFIRGGICANPVLPANTTNTDALQICAGESTILEATGANLQWYDSPNGGVSLSSNDQFSTPILYESTSFYASSKVCNVESDRLEIPNSVSQLPIVSIVENGGTLAALPDGASYQWIFCDGTSIENATLQEYSVSSLGSYAVIAEVGGCADTSSCFDVLITSAIHIFDQSKLSVYPNPAHEELVIDFEEMQSWVLFDLTGRIVQKGRSQILKRGDLSDGIYWIRVNNTKGFSAVKKVIFD